MRLSDWGQDREVEIVGSRSLWVRDRRVEIPIGFEIVGRDPYRVDGYESQRTPRPALEESWLAVDEGFVGREFSDDAGPVQSATAVASPRRPD